MDYSVIMSHRILQSEAWYGKTHVFFREPKNEFGENTRSAEAVAEIEGIFHTGSSDHKELMRTESGYVTDKNTPYILTTWECAKNIELQDYVVINGSRFNVTGITNIHEANAVGEISLEVVL